MSLKIIMEQTSLLFHNLCSIEEFPSQIFEFHRRLVLPRIDDFVKNFPKDNQSQVFQVNTALFKKVIFTHFFMLFTVPT